MKKHYSLLVVVLLVLLAVVYFLLPSQVTISEKVALQANQNGVVRLLTDKSKWQKWWPADQKAILYDSLNFSLQQELLKAVALEVPYADSTIRGMLNTVYYTPESSSVLFQLSLPPTSDPFQKISNYFKGQQIESQVEDVLSRLKNYAQKEENVYGMQIQQEKVKDSALVAIRYQSAGYPDPQSIYARVEELKSYIAAQGAKATDFPMLHAQAVDGKNYNVMVAIPVDRILNGNGAIEPKRMVLGKILVSEVKGGVHTIQKGMEELTNYVNDHRRTSPAIPFESLVTNRLEEPDTAKWITKLYYPVI